MSKPFQKLLAHIESEITNLIGTGAEIYHAPEQWEPLEYEELLNEIDVEIEALEAHADRLRTAL